MKAVQRSSSDSGAALEQRLGVPKSTVFYLRRQAHSELNRAYR